MTKKQSLWPAVAIIVIIYLLAALVEPCDGHSCGEGGHVTTN